MTYNRVIDCTGDSEHRLPAQCIEKPVGKVDEDDLLHDGEDEGAYSRRPHVKVVVEHVVRDEDGRHQHNAPQHGLEPPEAIGERG